MIKYNSRHSVIQTRWFDLQGFGAAEAAVAIALDCFANKDGWCWPSQATLAKMLKKSPAWVIDKINNLIELGIVEKQVRKDESGNLMTCLYRVRHDAISDEDPGRPANHPGQPANQTGWPAEINNTIEHIKPKKEARQSRLSDEWEPQQSDFDWANEKHPTVDTILETTKFKNYHMAKGSQMVNWSRAWMTWIINAEQFNGKRHSPAKTGSARPAYDRDANMQRIFDAASAFERNRSGQ